MAFRRSRVASWKVAVRNLAGGEASAEVAPPPSTVYSELESLLERRDKLLHDWEGIHNHVQVTLHPNNREAIAVLAAQLESKWSRAHKLTETIAERFPHAHARYESELYESIFDKMLACRVLVKPILEPPVPITVAPSAPSPATSVIINPQRSRPALHVKKFSGDYHEWLNWWEQYDAVIHSDSSIDDIAKFPYLREYLDGAAKDTIRGFPSTNHGYEQAVAKLFERYGDPEQITAAHIATLLQLPTVHRRSDVKGLRALYDGAVASIRALEAQGMQTATYSQFYQPMLLKRLPLDMIVDWKNREGSDAGTIDNLLDFIEREVKHKELALQLRREVCEPIKPVAPRQPSVPTVGQFVASTSQQPLSNEIRPTAHSATANQLRPRSKCVFCHEDHALGKCSVPLSRRQELVREQNRCLNCLSKNHFLRDCKSPYVCRFCSQKHHTTLCVQPSGSGTQGAAQSVVMCNVTPKRQVLLMTASVWLQGQAEARKILCLIDSGSDRSYIRQQFATSNLVNILCKDTLTFHSFGSSGTSSPRSSHLCELSVKGTAPSAVPVHLKAFAIDNICDLPAVPTLPLANELKQNQHWVADERLLRSNDGARLPVDLLIGSDYYWQVVNPQTRTSSCGLTAVSSKFGWLIHGTMVESKLNHITDVTCLCIESDSKPESIETSAKSIDTLVSPELVNTTDPPEPASDEKLLIEFQQGFARSTDDLHIGPLPNRPSVSDSFSKFPLEKGHFNSLLRNLSALPEALCVDRRHLIEDFTRPTNLSLPHSMISHFPSDASLCAYVTVPHLRSVVNGRVRQKFSCSNKQDNPPFPSNLSITRLKLMGEELFGRLALNLRSILHACPVQLWTSSVVLVTGIHGNPDTRDSFMQQRTREMSAHAEPRWWSHFPEHQHPTDLSSQGATQDQLRSDLWREGPSWLKLPSQAWPSCKSAVTNVPDLSSHVTHELRVGQKSAPKPTVNVLQVMVTLWIELWRHFGSYWQLLRVFAWLLRKRHRLVLFDNSTGTSINHRPLTTYQQSQTNSFRSVDNAYVQAAEETGGATLQQQHQSFRSVDNAYVQAAEETGGATLQRQHQRLPRQGKSRLTVIVGFVLCLLIPIGGYDGEVSTCQIHVRSEYLSNPRWVHAPGRITHPIITEHVVLVGDANHKRLLWYLGHVEATYPCCDGYVRAVLVETATGVTTRPIQSLYTWEICDAVTVPTNVGARDASISRSSPVPAAPAVPVPTVSDSSLATQNQRGEYVGNLGANYRRQMAIVRDANNHHQRSQPPHNLLAPTRTGRQRHRPAYLNDYLS